MAKAMDAFSASLMADKREIIFAPTVYKFETFAQMAEEFKLNERDVVLTNEFIYTPFMKDLGLKCNFVFQEKFGAGEPSEEMIQVMYDAIPYDSYDRVIAVGGGGIPVFRDKDGDLDGIAAVIDKDLASERLAQDLDADIFMMLTAVEKCYVNFRKPDQKALDKITVEEAKEYVRQGQFAAGSMLPKVEAAIRFVEARPGRRCIITTPDKSVEALKGNAGTIIC